MSDKPLVFGSFQVSRPAEPGCLKITEHYLCEEGEGSTLGALTYLVRLSGCNLRCWWCDSKHSSFDDAEEKMVSALALEKAALASHALWVSFTGGEPTWRNQAELKTLASLCKRLRRAGRRVKIETNGLSLPSVLTTCVDLWSVAPKWDGAKSYAQQRQKHMDYDPGNLLRMTRAFAPGRMQIKFVISSLPDGSPRATNLKRVSEILGPLEGSKRPPVFFIPEAYGKGDYLERCRALGKAVEAMASSLKGWDLRVQPQWHRVLFGDARGR